MNQWAQWAQLKQIAAVILTVAASPAFSAMQNQDAPDSTTVATLRDRIELAYKSQDVATIEAARQALLAVSGDPEDGVRASYYAAYARFRQALAAGGEPKLARGYLEDCIAELRDFIERQPADAEARALLGSCYGISSLHHGLSMAKRGLEARRHMAAARELAPDNPWVVLQDGLADYSTPRLFGGDRQLAISKLERATALFTAAATAGSSRATWGAAETWQQLGRMYQETGRADDARAAFASAEALAPERQVLAAL